MLLVKLPKHVRANVESTTQIEKAEPSAHCTYRAPRSSHERVDAVTPASSRQLPASRRSPPATRSASRTALMTRGLTVEQVLAAAELVVSATDLPVSVDFEKGYSPDARGVQHNVELLVSTGAAGLNIEDFRGGAQGADLRHRDGHGRVAAARRCGGRNGVPS